MHLSVGACPHPYIQAFHGEAGYTIVLCVYTEYTESAPTGVYYHGNPSIAFYKKSGDFVLFPSMGWHRSVPPKSGATYLARKMSFFFKRAVTAASSWPRD